MWFPEKISPTLGEQTVCSVVLHRIRNSKYLLWTCYVSGSAGDCTSLLSSLPSREMRSGPRFEQYKAGRVCKQGSERTDPWGLLGIQGSLEGNRDPAAGGGQAAPRNLPVIILSFLLLSSPALQTSSFSPGFAHVPPCLTTLPPHAPLFFSSPQTDLFY